MKQKGRFNGFGFGLIVIFLCIASAYGQISDELVDIVSDDGSVSFTVPANSLVYREANRIRVFLGSGEADISITIENKVDARKYVKAFKRAGTGVTGEDEKQFSIRRYEFVRTDSYGMTIYYGAADTFFSITGASDTKSNPDIERFFSSIRLPLVPPAAGVTTNAPAKQNKQLKYSQLTTSQPVSESLAVPDASSRLVSYVKVKMEEKPFDKNFSRRLIVLTRPMARYTDSARQAGKEGNIPAEVQFLANGKIGYIRIDPTLDPTLAANVAAATRQIKFVPAQIKGQPVDAVRLIMYNFDIY